MTWQDLATAKRRSLLDAFPVQWRLLPSQTPPSSRLADVTGFIRQHLDPAELNITDASADTIIERLRSGDLSATEVTRAFCHRAALAHQLTNCLSEVFFDSALQRAAELDHHFQTTGQTVGPLHGLPVSLKDRFNIAGIASACGYVSWLDHIATVQDEGTLVRKLRAAGAVLFVKTNVPMSLLMGETSNNIIGSTCNPYNRRLSAGGASGGEGALLALRGSPLGWGSDIAGSVRIPCAFNNLYGLRPSCGRLPASGMATSLPGLPVAQSVIGPMATSLDVLTSATKWIINEHCWRDEFEALDLPWNEPAYQATRARKCRPGARDGKLVFALMLSDGDVRPHPPVLRALRMVAAALRQRGYEVIDWTPPPHGAAATTLFQLFGSTAGATVRAALDASGEPPVHQLRGWYGSHPSSTSSDAADFWALCAARDGLRQAYHEHWEKTTVGGRAVDGVVLPVAPSAAVEEGFFHHFAYTAVASCLDYAAGCVPVTFADAAVDVGEVGYGPLNQEDRRHWRTYQKELFDGAPVGVQVMGRRLQEEKVLGMMEAVAEALREFEPDGGVAAVAGF
ncbi:putative general amidase GmdA [Neofusicoccum parvum]|uniref:General amidase GmdA n=1 Tax=Neofusicoccum parvum TaxID=310453 RepID=A0ACB5SQP1_9PEZI|nr:putative general amidase GmdA [Neofusicoccum parvum]